jgi:HTH-type transcriptional regulator / antitoxin HigA
MGLAWLHIRHWRQQVQVDRRCAFPRAKAVCAPHFHAQGVRQRASLIFSPNDIEVLVEHLRAVAAKVPLRPITSRAQYVEAARVLNALLDAGAANEEQELAGLVDALGEFIEGYDEVHYVLPDASPADVLREPMPQHDIKQSDFPEIESQGVVSELLNEKREINTRQICAISKRFSISPALFFSSM